MIAFDIETTGLDPHEDIVRAISWASDDAAWGEAGVIWGPEKEVLDRFEVLLSEKGTHTLVTWNGHEFDLPFLAVRLAKNGIINDLHIHPTGEKGKYGNPLYGGLWYGVVVQDIAPEWRTYAENNDVKWSLKPVAESLGLHPQTIPLDQLTDGDLISTNALPYAVSDAVITLRLAQMVDEGI